MYSVVVSFYSTIRLPQISQKMLITIAQGIKLKNTAF